MIGVLVQYEACVGGATPYAGRKERGGEVSITAGPTQHLFMAGGRVSEEGNNAAGMNNRLRRGCVKKGGGGGERVMHARPPRK